MKHETSVEKKSPLPEYHSGKKISELGLFQANEKMKRKRPSRFGCFCGCCLVTLM